jgi:hypothetical protein
MLMLVRQSFSVAQVHRTLLTETVGSFAPLVSLSRQAVRQRLIALGLTPFTQLLERVQQALPHRESASPCLASFAPLVVALDETTLSDIAKLADGATLLLEQLPKASLMVADLGYFGYAWFRFVSEQGSFWISRLKDKACFHVVHTFSEKGETLDALIWLGAYRSNQYPHLVRLVPDRQGKHLSRYLTNVTDPRQLSLAEIACLYARRWDIEMACKLLKRTLGLHVWWACERTLVLHQLLLTLMLALLIHALQGEIAAEAGVDPQEVSLVILLRLLPHASWPSPFGMATALVAKARLVGLIRPSRYLKLDLPLIPLQELQPVPPDLVKERPWKRTVRKDPPHPRCTEPSDFLFFPLAFL